MAKKSRNGNKEEPGLSPLGALAVIIILGIYSFLSGVVGWIIAHPLETVAILIVILVILYLLFYILYKKFGFNVITWFYGGLKNLWSVYVLKKQPSSTIPTKKQSIGSVKGGSTAQQFQVDGDMHLYPQQPKTKSKFNVFEKAYTPLYDKMISVIQQVENFNKKIEFTALDNIYGKTAWSLMEPNFIGKFNKYLALKRAYEEAHKDLSLPCFLVTMF